MNIEVTTPLLQRLKNIKNIKFNTNLVASILLVIIVIIIPVLFLQYVSERTIQILLTYYFTGIALLVFLGIKIHEEIKLKENFNWHKKVKIDFVDICLIIYSILIFISTIVSEYFPDTIITGSFGRFEGALTLYLYIILFYIAYKLFNFSEKYLPYVAASTLIVSCIGVVQALFSHMFSKYQYMGYASFGNPNFFSSYLSLFLPIYIIVYLKKNKPFYLITSIITFFGLVCSKTTGGYITFAIYFTIILIYAICTHVKFKNIAILLLSFALVFILANLCTDNAYIKELIPSESKSKSVQENYSEEDSFANGRGLAYRFGLDIVKKNPLLGIGPDCLGMEIFLKYYFRPDYTSELLYDKAHSEYLQIAICTGIPSLIVYLLFICTIAFKLLRKFFKNTSNITIFAIGISIMSYLIQAVSNISVTHVAPIFWIMLGIGYGLCKRPSTEKT